MNYRNEWLAAVLIVVCITLSAIAQLMFRFGMMNFDLDTYWPTAALSAWSVPVRATLIGAIAYAISVACWLPVLSRVSLSKAYPMLSISYIAVYIGAVYWPGMGESPSSVKVAGIVFIIIGVIFVHIGDSSGFESGGNHD